MKLFVSMVLILYYCLTLAQGQQQQPLPKKKVFGMEDIVPESKSIPVAPVELKNTIISNKPFLIDGKEYIEVGEFTKGENKLKITKGKNRDFFFLEIYKGNYSINWSVRANELRELQNLVEKAIGKSSSDIEETNFSRQDVDRHKVSVRSTEGNIVIATHNSVDSIPILLTKDEAKEIRQLIASSF